MKNNIFSGRVIFDHQPKTGGTSVASWLMKELGVGCVTPNVIGEHRDLIKKYGGLYSVISTHMNFSIYKGLDPRYQYITLLRDPIDRLISHLYFLLNNYDDTHIPELRNRIKIFIDSEGENFDKILELAPNLSNLYVNHFSSINGDIGMGDDDKLASALAAIQEYDVVGVHENMPQYFIEVSTLIGLVPPQEIPHINKTKKRPDIMDIPDSMLNKIMEVNQLDIRFYSEVLAWKTATACIQTHKIQKKWNKYDSIYDGLILTDVSGSLTVTTPIRSTKVGSQTTISVEITNSGKQSWPGEGDFRPVLLSYHWLKSSGEMYTFDGQRTILPRNGVIAGTSVNANMLIKAPETAGHYILELTLIQERVAWFERIGFMPTRLEIEVI
jgi:hypothetical protein